MRSVHLYRRGEAKRVTRIHKVMDYALLTFSIVSAAYILNLIYNLI